MKHKLLAILAVGLLAGPMAAQAAIKVQATQKKGVALVFGSDFANRAAITWEGIAIGKTVCGGTSLRAACLWSGAFSSWAGSGQLRIPTCLGSA
jgi:hypothetical protein